MPQDEQKILELENQIRPLLKDFLVGMLERSFAAAAQMGAKNLNIASGMTRSETRQELKLIDSRLCQTANESIGLLPELDQRLVIGQQLDVAEDIYLMGHQLAVQRLHV